MKRVLTAVAMMSCSCQTDLNASDLARLAEFWGCCDSRAAGWSEDGDIVLAVDMPGIYEPGEYLVQFGDSTVEGTLRRGKNFGDDVEPPDTGTVFHGSSVTREKFYVVSGTASITRTPRDSWLGDGLPGCNGHDVLDLTLSEPVFERDDGLRRIETDSFAFPPLCVGWKPY